MLLKSIASKPASLIYRTKHKVDHKKEYRKTDQRIKSIPWRSSLCQVSEFLSMSVVAQLVSENGLFSQDCLHKLHWDWTFCAHFFTFSSFSLFFSVMVTRRLFRAGWNARSISYHLVASTTTERSTTLPNLVSSMSRWICTAIPYHRRRRANLSISRRFFFRWYKKWREKTTKWRGS